MNPRHRSNDRSIEVTVSPTGAITVEAEGYTGASCEEATRFLEEALGQPGKRVRKGEFYRKTTRNNNRQQLGSP